MDVKSEVCKPSRLPPDYAESEDIVGFVQERVQFAQRRAQALLTFKLLYSARQPPVNQNNVMRFDITSADFRIPSFAKCMQQLKLKGPKMHH